MYSRLEKLVLKYVIIIHIITFDGNQYSFKKQQQNDMTFSLKGMGIITCILFCMKKTLKKRHKF